MTTFSHKGSILPIRNRVLSVDEHTTFLAHYDLNENDVLKGIKPVGEQYALLFNGSTCIEMPPLITTNMTQLTVEQWIYWDGSMGAEKITYNQEYSFEGRILDGYFQYAWQPYWEWSGGTSTPITANTWTHIAVTYGGAYQRIYKNGVETYSRAQTGAISGNTNPFRIGARGYITPESLFGGKILNTRIWSRALTAEEIQKYIYENPSPEANGLIGWWPGNEGKGNIIYDLSPYQNDGRVVGTATWKEGNSIFTLRPQEGKFGGGISIEEGTSNLIRGGDMSTPALPENAHEDYTTGKVSVIPTPFPNPINSPYVIKYDATAGATSELEFNPKNGATFGPGKYTLSCYVWVSEDWDGQLQLLHNRWWDATGVITEYAGAVFPTKRCQWERISITMDMGARIPTTFAWYFSYPNLSKKGVIYITGLQVENKPFATSFVNGVRDSGILEYPTLGILNPNAGTINVWVNVRDDLPDHDWRMIFVTKDKGRLDGTETNQIRMGFVKNWYTWHWKMVGSGGGSFYQTLAVTKGWHMFTITWDKTTGIKCYYDGELKYSTTDKTCIPSQFYPTFWLGTWLGVGYQSNHIIDELRIDKIARTDEEIAAWYYSNSPFWPRGIYRKA